MWKQEATNLLTRFTLILVFTAYLYSTARALSDKRLCADENCKEIISMGTGKINYRAGEEGMVSFKMNSNIRIKSKSAGNKPSLWGIEVNGREGYAPKELIRENKVIISEKDLKFIVDVEQKKTVKILATSESLSDQENTLETKTTTPLNVTPAESTENLLKNSTNEKFTAGSSPVATPVQSEIADGTEIPIYANDADGNVRNENDEVKPLSNIEMEPVTNNADVDSNYGEKDVVEVGKSQKETKATDSKSVEIVNDITETTDQKQSVTENESLNKEETVEGLEEPEINTESSDGVIEKNFKFDEINIDTKTKDETANLAESVGEEIKHTKGNTNVPNIDIDDKKGPTFSVQNQNPTTKAEITSENSLQVALQSQEYKTTEDDDRYHANVNIANNVNETINAESYNSTKSTSADVKNDNYKSAEGPEFTKAEKIQVETKYKEEEISTSEFLKSPAVLSENSKEENENKYTKVDDDIGNIENIDKKNKTTQKVNGSHTNANNIDDVNKIIKPVIYNVSESNAEVNGDNSKITSSNLDEIISETTTNMNLKNYQQEVAETLNTNNEDPMQKSKTDTNNSLPKEHHVKKTDIRDSATESNADKEIKTLNENPPQRSTPASPEEVVNEKGIVEDNDSPQNHLSTENQIHEHKTTYNDVLGSDKTNILINNIKGVEETFNNQQEAKTEEDYKEIPSIKSKLDKEINNVNSMSTETVDFAYDKENLIEVSTATTNPDEKTKTNSDSLQHTEKIILKSTTKIPEQVLIQEEIVLENINPTTYHPSDDIPLSTPLPTKIHYPYEELTTTKIPPTDIYGQQSKESQKNLGSFEKQTTDNYNSLPTMSTHSDSQTIQMKGEPHALPSSTPFEGMDGKENKGLFATIMGTVNNMLSTNKKNKQNELDGDRELERILFSKKNNNEQKIDKLIEENSFQYCKNIGPNGDCPESEENYEPAALHSHTSAKPTLGADLTLDTFLTSMASKILEMSDVLAFSVVVAAATLFFVFGYYCFCNSSREGALLLKLNQFESSLLASHKENAILKHNLMATRQKLTSIEDNSFGSNDMVVSLKKELEEELMEKARLQEQITVLQKELENAADAGIELNKIVSELLSNQTGDESIISSVEELQKQLNEQQNTIFEINASLAEKSRENSELQLLIAEQNARYETELANIQRDNDELDHEKGNLLTKLNEMKNDFDKDITAALEGKNIEIKRLQNDIVDLTNKLENEHTKWQTSVAKIEALEECLKNIRRDPNVNITEVINVANVKAQLIEIQKKYKSLKERHETELDSRKLAESQLKVISAEVEKLKQDFNQSEKDKLEAQTRLEVLSNYFKDKENQLQKELSLKEAMWLKQQGETTTTVDRLTAMQEEIQSLKSLNDSLRAEIEAQLAAHKAQTGTLENRAHETWLAARQSDRRYEEARAEATALRRKLTALAGGNVNEVNKPPAASTALGDNLTQAPSPIHMESPGSPMLGRMPPPPFLPPPFMGHPPPFMGMPPPPPFVPPGEMRPAPLGRIMSPPPQRSGRFSPQQLDYEDYLDYDSNNTWHRHTYSPTPRTYRSLSPTDSRYNYGTERDLMSTYDTEAGFSPPPSPRDSRRRVGNSSERVDNNAKISYGNTKKFYTSSKGPLSSGSENSFNTHSETKTKKGNASGGGKSLV